MEPKFLHVGIPSVKVRPNEEYVDKMRIYKVEPKYNEFPIEYIRFMDGTPFPEIMHHSPHIAFEVDSIAEASKDARVIVEPMDLGHATICFVVKDNVIFELMEMKK
ncbi:MAG: VOC family protein [Christensenellales bacterium]|jgi:glyoxylase I family protein